MAWNVPNRISVEPGPPPPPLPLVLLATPGLVLEEKAEGGEAKQEGLGEPQAARGRAGDAFVAAGTRTK